MTAIGQTKIEQAAIAAAELAATGIHPVTAWDSAAARIFGASSMAVKNCPKSAFLGLAEDGRLKGVGAGTYTKSLKNKKYALGALNILQSDERLASAPMQLWHMVMNGEPKKYNHQMHVVSALWKARKFVCQT